MAKETAHQLGNAYISIGCPVSMMQDEETDQPGKYGMLPEITKDVNRLQSWIS